MIKKFVSRALLSVVMDKQARRKLDAAREAKAENTGKAGAKVAADKNERKQRPPKPPGEPVSYTHLTLPTIYSV